jgi:hypothetical protein
VGTGGIPAAFAAEFEALEVARCLRAGLTESQLLPRAETVSSMRILDRVRPMIGLRYPAEERR